MLDITGGVHIGELIATVCWKPVPVAGSGGGGAVRTSRRQRAGGGACT